MRSPGTTNLQTDNLMNSSPSHEWPAARTSDRLPEKCMMCDYPIEDRCFCKIHNGEPAPVNLCCPDCVLQYLDSKRNPDDPWEEELRDHERNLHFFIGEDKPWS